MFVDYAFAGTLNNAVQTPNPMGTIAQFVLIFLVFYFLLIRPQQKKVKEHAKMLSEIEVGNQIITGGGILAKVSKIIDEETLLININDEVKVKILRSTVRDVVKENTAKDKKEEKKTEKNS